MQKLIIIRGYPGSGKTTLGTLMQDRGHGAFIDHNAILTFIAGITGDDEGIYNEIHALERAMTRKLLSEGKSVIVARGFGTVKSMEPYLEAAKQTDSAVTVIRLEVPIAILEQRVQSSERKLGFNPTVTPHSLKQWVQGNPLSKVEQEITLDASQPIETVLAVAELKLQG